MCLSLLLSWSKVTVITPVFNLALDLSAGSLPSGLSLGEQYSIDLSYFYPEKIRWCQEKKKKVLSVLKQILIHLESQRPLDVLHDFVLEEAAFDKSWGMVQATGKIWIQKHPSPQQVQADAIVQAYFCDGRIQLRKINKTTKIFSFSLFILFLMLKNQHITYIFRSHESKIIIFGLNTLIDLQYSSFPAPISFLLQ